MATKNKSLLNQNGMVVWISGLSGSGKTTISIALQQYLIERGYHCVGLDGDVMRQGLCKDLSFTEESRQENIRRSAEVAKICADNHAIVLCSFITPTRAIRGIVRKILESSHLIEVSLSTPLSVCESRDPKGLYLKARQGQIENFTGISSLFEPLMDADIMLDTSTTSLENCINTLGSYILKKQSTLGY